MKKIIYPETTIADRYRIVTEIGQGAFGTTYEAEDLTNYKRVAIKVLSLRKTQNWKALDLFDREAKVLARIDHPSIPKYLDYFHEDRSDDRLFYLVQELVSGESLSTLVKKGWHANEKQVQEIALQLLTILDNLHRMQPTVIHRDIKPSNIIRRPDGQIYLVDFGAVKDVCRHSLMPGETFIGTIGYMPPEQFRGNAFFASDLYALGATLLFLLTHRSPEELPRKRMKFDFRDRVNISPDFANWLDKMLEPIVEDRYHSAKEAMGVLQNRKNIERVNLSSYPVKKAAPPKGSSIILNQSQNRLILELPTNTNIKFFVVETTLILAFAMLPFCFSLIWISSLFIHNYIILMLVFYFLLALLQINFKNKELYLLDIDSHNYYLIREQPLGGEQISGKTVDIQGCRLQMTDEIRNAKCLLTIGNKDYEFGMLLTPVEKQWLVGEISDFLKMLKSERAENKLSG